MPTAAKTAAEKAEVKTYFETTGFDRWNRIYSESEDVNKVQRNIRIGHQKTVDNVLAWLQEQGNLEQRSFCDAGCGVGSLTLPLAQLGAGSISASDLSAAMVQEAERRAAEMGVKPGQISFLASDLESLSGRYDTVICLDVLPTRRCWRCSQRSANSSLAPARPPGPTPSRNRGSWPPPQKPASSRCAAASTRPPSISHG